MGTAITAVLSGCEAREAESVEQTISYSPNRPGEAAIATNPKSFELLSADGPARFVSFQRLIAAAGNKCSYVTSAVLRGGFDRSDEWRIDCVDSGTWAVWFKPGKPVEVLSCSRINCS